MQSKVGDVRKFPISWFSPHRNFHFGTPQTNSSGSKKWQGEKKKRRSSAHFYTFPFHFKFSSSPSTISLLFLSIFPFFLGSLFPFLLLFPSPFPFSFQNFQSLGTRSPLVTPLVWCFHWKFLWILNSCCSHFESKARCECWDWARQLPSFKSYTCGLCEWQYSALPPKPCFNPKMVAASPGSGLPNLVTLYPLPLELAW